VKYYFAFTNAAALVTNALNNALFRVAAGFTVDDALRKNLAGLQERVAARVEELARDQNLGITVQQVDLVAAAPRQVKAAFDEVNLAENEQGTKINNAQAEANGILARAGGEAAGHKNAAETDRSRMVADLEGEARYFTELLPSYERDTVLFTRRLQIEHLGRIMTNAQDKFFLPARADGRPRELRLQLNREPQKLAAPIAAPKSDEHSH
jgi:membrane protease subunit HflK